MAIEPGADRGEVERVHGFHAEPCPVAWSIGCCIAITTELKLREV